MQRLLEGAAAIAGDRDAGAAELLERALPLLAEALVRGPSVVVDVARVICRGQPAMAPLWNACAAAVADRSTPGRFDRVRAEMERAPAALVRAAGSVLRDAFQGRDPARIVTLSYSSSVASVLAPLAREAAVQVTCGEGRPRYEGRRMAARLAAAGATVTLTTDAALTTALAAATAVVTGADAFGRSSWTNKVGTLGLAAAAQLAGVPVFVVTTCDKAHSGDPMPALAFDGPGGEIVDGDAPPGVSMANPYFESIPAELATLFLMDGGPVAPSDLGQLVDRFVVDHANLIRLL